MGCLGFVRVYVLNAKQQLKTATATLSIKSVEVDIGSTVHGAVFSVCVYSSSSWMN